jgi:Protein of unknown function (DUF2911)
MTRKILLIFGILLVLVMLFMVFGRQYYTKQFSPEDHAALDDGKVELTVFYNRPFKRGREIFGGLVPYGKVWRTGANEATWFETDKDLTFSSGSLKAGRYSLWTIPDANTWKVIFNSNIPPWGVNYNSEAARNMEFDVLILDVPVNQKLESTEQFTITLTSAANSYSLNLLWDKTVISVPITVSEP